MFLTGIDVNDVTLAEDENVEEREAAEINGRDRLITQRETNRDMGSSLADLLRPFMENFTAPLAALAKAQMETSSSGSRKRKHDEEEEDDVKGMPELIVIPEHELRDNAHTVIDWTARSLRPYNGGDQDLFWSKVPKKVSPVIEDIKIGHLTKAPINPNVIAKIHDRGTETTGKQWLSSNYGVEGKGGKIRAENDRTAGAFVLDYAEPSGVWEAIDAIHNYQIALRSVRPEDWTADLLLKTIHDCRNFAVPSFSGKQQKDIIMDLFNQVLRQNAMKGRSKKPPMDRTEMLDLAKHLLFQ